MAKPRAFSALLLVSLLVTEATAALGGVARTYIVQMNTATTTTGSSNRLARRQSSLEAASVDPSAMFYSYDVVLDGFAATMTDDQAAALRAQPDVLSVRRDSRKALHTTHTPEFLGLVDASGAAVDPTTYVSASSSSSNTSSAAEEEASIIIGVLDTGAWPESASYDDTDMPATPLPASWTGACEEGQDWTAATACNNKLIGARAFYKGLDAAYAAENVTYDWSREYRSARDAEGHGTHTSSTIAGAAVVGAGLYGQAAGTARGVAVGARLAIYKVCYLDAGCFDSDILAAMDAAVRDGVDVISSKLLLLLHMCMGEVLIYTHVMRYGIQLGLLPSLSYLHSGYRPISD